jgi:uncharacterized protein YciI
MFVVTLNFGPNKARAPEFMSAHNAWIAQGFADGVFLVTGSLADGAGGCVIAHGEDAAALGARVAADPFVAQGIVTPRIAEIRPGRVDPRVNFLMG